MQQKKIKKKDIHLSVIFLLFLDLDLTSPSAFPLHTTCLQMTDDSLTTTHNPNTLLSLLTLFSSSVGLSVMTC